MLEKCPQFNNLFSELPHYPAQGYRCVLRAASAERYPCVTWLAYGTQVQLRGQAARVCGPRVPAASVQ
jgi:hypothetical protein